MKFGTLIVVTNTNNFKCIAKPELHRFPQKPQFIKIHKKCMNYLSQFIKTQYRFTTSTNLYILFITRYCTLTMRCHGNGKQRKTNFQVQEMQVVRTICSSTANTSTVTLIFLHYFNNNDATIRCQFYDQRRRKLYHTLLGHGGQGGETSSQMDQRPLQRVWVGYFLSHRTVKIPSSINKPVQSCKIQGKWSEKKREISNHG